MAFKMIRPTIKGSPIQKASAVKATAKPVVANTRTTADPGLIWAADELGKSLIPGAIDYGIDAKWDLDFSREKDKEEDTDQAKRERKWFKDRGENAKNNQLSEEEFFGNRKKKEVEPIEIKNKLEPIATDVNTEDDQLATATGTAPDSGDDTDRFIDAAEGFGMEINTVEDYNRAEEAMFYDDEADEWALKPVDITPAPRIEVRNMEIGGNVDDQLALPTVEIPESTTDTDRFADAAEKRGYDMTTEEGWAAAEQDGEYNEETGEWEFYGVQVDELTSETDPEVIKLQNEAFEKLQKEKEEKKRLALEEKEREKERKKTEKIAIFEQNKIDAKIFYDEHGEDLTQESFNEYVKMKGAGTLDEYGAIEIEEEDDPEPGDPDYEKYLEEEKKRIKIQKFNKKDDNNNGLPDYLEIEPPGPVQGPKQDEDPDKNKNGIPDYLEVDNSGNSAMQQRDNRIWRNAVDGGPVQQSMRNSGYIPLNERK